MKLHKEPDYILFAIIESDEFPSHSIIINENIANRDGYSHLKGSPVILENYSHTSYKMTYLDENKKKDAYVPKTKCHIIKRVKSEVTHLTDFGCKLF
jgi:hypothetical protein